jgi:uncharacterized membrane protein YraQ (UPF0718 family)
MDARQDFALAFLSILFEGAPFILLGTLVSGLLDVYLPSGAMERLLPKNRVAAVLVSCLLGAIFPVCECAVVPVIRRLVKKGLPVSCGLGYMLAAPIVNPITALSTWKAFEGQSPLMMTGGRLALGYLIAVAVALIVLRLPVGMVLRPSMLAEPAPSPDESPAESCGDHGCGCHGEAPDSSDGKLVAAFRSALKDFVDVGVWFSIGVALTALFNTGLAPGARWLDQVAQHPAGAPAALMGLAYVLSLCSTSDAFIAATLDRFSWGAKLAFLVFGPMLDVKLTFLYQSVLRKRFILALAAGLFVAIGTLSMLWQFWLTR